MNELEIAVSIYQQALASLIDGLKRAIDDLDKDGVIQRFEFTGELLWKTLKLIIENEGYEFESPKQCIKLAFESGLIIDDSVYLDILQDRNRSSHLYNEKESYKIFERIKTVYAEALTKAGNRFKEHLKNRRT